MNVVLFDPTDDAIVTFDWSDVLPSGITISSVAHAVDSPLTKGAESAVSPFSYVKISGALHGGLYMVNASAALSNGEVINRQFPIRGWNS